MINSSPGCELEIVIATDQLDARPSRPIDEAAETAAFLELVQELAKAPESLFPEIVAAVLKFSNAESAGISLLDESRGIFVWPAVTGGLARYVGAGTPADFGPCGTVLDRDAPVLFRQPQRYFTYLAPIKPALEEVLLVPFYMNGKPVGTVWAVIHKPGQKFDAEDRRLLENLSDFAASSFRILSESDALRELLKSLPGPN
ncbi:GAF domain-containing protein [Luteolibacter sp. GHJ8]|uniref:GAF domain-containing protein n=1 Tax=Luteolibacter rhizosphaerae TaxID=2989719 RepID=A0ABT3G8B7_9BACT|nr:GAF domain-containing protein [Luteolibacter rhizosphaerae]MCW1915872.1 GAF domain-containing protein [Luteolibacter rhizosphaerae]